MSISQQTIDMATRDGGAMPCYVTVPESGHGPGLLLLHDAHGLTDYVRHAANLYAEEGWVAAAPDLYWRIERGAHFDYGEAGARDAAAFVARLDVQTGARDAADALLALKGLPPCAATAGVIGEGIGGLLACLLPARYAGVACAVSYDPVGLAQHVDELRRIGCPLLLHFAARDDARASDALERLSAVCAGQDRVALHVYPGTTPGFANRNRASWDRPAYLMSKSRTLATLREVLGPRYDLAALWDAHLHSEFVDRDVDASMGTMVDEPYVLVVPTVTGGTGKRDLHRWYSDHFHFQNPPDASIVPISRTVGIDRLVDEFVFCFTHDRVMDWILPGVAPTGRYIEIPMMAVVNFRGPKLYHEHIWWDQASVLVQAGLLDPTGLPVTGAEQAAALRDETLPRNRLIPGWE